MQINILFSLSDIRLSGYPASQAEQQTKQYQKDISDVQALINGLNGVDISRKTQLIQNRNQFDQIQARLEWAEKYVKKQQDSKSKLLMDIQALNGMDAAVFFVVCAILLIVVATYTKSCIKIRYKESQ